MAREANKEIETIQFDLFLEIIIDPSINLQDSMTQTYMGHVILRLFYSVLLYSTNY